ncbi:MAG: aminoacetone oxidase family FAD-binding enzyme, partial [Eubacteriales bacterium]|nr:aminoacetone oxidase family FAD-binding enzyme [Eubacteriales bacterium]
AAQVIGRFPPGEVCRFFEQLGLRTQADEEGRVYPLCGQAAAVLDTLRLRIAELGIEERCEFDCASISRQGEALLLRPVQGEAVRARRVVLCAGGMAAPKVGGTDAGVKLLASLGHSAVPRRPALTQIDTDAEPIRALKGLRYQGGVSLLIDGRAARREEGEILFGEGSLSGIAVMQLSRLAADALRRKKKSELALHILPDRPESLFKELLFRSKNMPRRELNDFLTGLVSKRIGQSICKIAGAAPLTRLAESLDEAELRAVARLLTDWRLPVKGVKGFDSAQVTAGGAELSAFDPQTMRSRIVPELYAAGEVLDVDGDCGGFNLQWAWASGMLAGRSAALSL